jgi:small-conductance mechanosensitive channel
MPFISSMRKSFSYTCIVAIIALILAGTCILHAQTQPAARPATAPVTDQPDDILKFLNQAVVWYRLLNTQQQLVNEPSDSVFLSDNRQIADQVVRLAFEFARAEAQQLTTSSTAQNTPAPPNPTQYQNLLNLSEKTKGAIDNQEKEIESLKQQLAKATGKKQKMLEAAVAESEDELDLLKARYQTVQDILQFTSGMNASTGPKGLPAQIEDLARTVPATASESKQSSQAAASTQATIPPPEKKTESGGLFGLIAEIFEYRRKLHLLDASLRQTDSLAAASAALRSPLVARMRELTERSDQLAAEPQSQDPQVLAQQQAELKDLTRQYKLLSAAILPLGKQNILFDLYKRNVSNWQNEVQIRYSEMLKTLLLRLGSLAGIVVIILACSYIWRRATFRYVQDGRRRHQFLILRRIIVIPMLLVVIVFTFANGLGSVTLFAGLSTAGLAVALQNLIQAVVGYFVLIGKFGVRVGDRIQVAGVFGEVMDIGMVRLHLVEMSPGPGSRPTGRVVAFSNSVVFQPNAGLFKQIPGTNFVWHEVALTVSAGSDYRQVEDRMMQAVKRIFADYQEKMELQRRSLERAIHGFSAEPLRPESRLDLTPSGTQIAVRYPVEMDSASEMDDRIVREILDVTGRKPEVFDAASHERTDAAAEASSGN